MVKKNRNEYMRKYRKTEAYKKYYIKMRERRRKYKISWRNKNPDKWKKHKQIQKMKRKQNRTMIDMIRDFARHNLRNLMLKRDDYKCTACGFIKNLEMHEKRYEYPQKLENMITLCLKCHHKLHRKIV